MNISERLRILRNVNGVTLKELGAVTKEHFSSIAYFETRKTSQKQPYYDKLVAGIQKIKGANYLDVFSWKERAEKWDALQEFQNRK
jgi:transcriptional regulator with XRE-family HTH domain